MVCVCKSGGDFDERWVYALERATWANIVQPHIFLCLTDLDPKRFDRDFVELVKLKHDWPGWWSKLELFRPDIFDDGDQIIYLDLDTIITRDISHLEGAIDCDLLMLRDFYRPKTHMGSGMMGWTAGQFGELYVLLESHPDFVGGSLRGDQQFIQQVIDPKRVRFWQDEFPDQIVSYKVHVNRGVLPAKAHVVCFHGQPRPNQIVEGWIKDRWNLSGGNIL